MSDFIQISCCIIEILCTAAICLALREIRDAIENKKSDDMSSKS